MFHISTSRTMQPLQISEFDVLLTGSREISYTIYIADQNLGSGLQAFSLLIASVSLVPGILDVLMFPNSSF